jgi:SAM-dependent methyltransferase
MLCRFCATELKHIFASLGSSPLSNSFLTKEQLIHMEPFFPLTAYVCDNCFLVQLDEFESPENIFGQYVYFSSYSQTWLDHCKDYVREMTGQLALDGQSQVVEIASNDGYLLQYFLEREIPVLGVEPAANVAEVAIQKGVPTEISFFGLANAKRLALAGKSADLLIGNNVLAHVPDLNDFVQGLKMLLKPQGTITMEFPHLLRLIEGVQFDTIYHEHFSYLSLKTVQEIFNIHGLTIYDVDELPTHGGSIRIYARHSENPGLPVSESLSLLIQRELDAGLADIAYYQQFEEKIRVLKREFLSFLIQAKSEGKTIAGYGAAAKGNTLLNYCGVRTDFIDYVADKNPYKQGLYLPGSHIPVVSPKQIMELKPDYLLIFPWNIKEEIIREMDFIRQWDGKFVTAVPEIQVI